MGEIVVRRKSGPYVDAFRAYKIRLDGLPAGDVRARESSRREASVGEHTLPLTIDWTGSKELTFDLDVDETAAFDVSPNGSPLAGLVNMFARTRRIALTRST